MRINLLSLHQIRVVFQSLLLFLSFTVICFNSVALTSVPTSMTMNAGTSSGVVTNLSMDNEGKVVNYYTNINGQIMITFQFSATGLPANPSLKARMMQLSSLDIFSFKYKNAAGSFIEFGSTTGNASEYKYINLTLPSESIVGSLITIRLTSNTSAMNCNLDYLVIKDSLTSDAITSPPSGKIAITPVGSTGIFNNPERGFHKYEGISTSVAKFQENAVNGSTLNIVVISLEAFKNTTISSDFITQYEAMFSRARTAGVKLILLHRYHEIANFASDPSEATIMNHINQLAPVITANADVVYVVHAGFIGAWGEWYFTQHDFPTKERIFKALVQSLPTSLTVAIRTPILKIDMFAMTGPNKPTLDPTLAKRVGHHNDCFLANADDMGTGSGYNLLNPSDWRDFIGRENKALAIPVGGETCAVSGYSGCTNALTQMRRQGYSYLNIDYNGDVISSWKNDGCFAEINRNLGYRLKINRASFPTTASRVGTIDLSFSIQNLGFSGLVNPRPMKLVLYNLLNTYSLDLGQSAQRFTPGITYINKAISLNSLSIVKGNYKMAIWMPDRKATLQNKSVYSLQFANQNTWDNLNGRNILKDINGISATINITD